MYTIINNEVQRIIFLIFINTRPTNRKLDDLSDIILYILGTRNSVLKLILSF